MGECSKLFGKLLTSNEGARPSGIYAWPRSFSMFFLQIILFLQPNNETKTNRNNKLKWKT